MYQKFGLITNHNKKYNYIYCDIIGLLYFVINNNNYYKESFIHLLKKHRAQNNDIFNLVIEDYRNLKLKNCVKYLLIYNKSEIICSSRVIYKKTGLIQFVHTIKKYRNKKFGQLNIKKIMNLTNKYFKIYKFELSVSQKNIRAITFYERIGFTTKYINKLNNYVMKITLK